MSGIFASLNTSTKGLMASQTALHTTGHNISNINTPGYTRQRVDMKADKAFSYTGVGQLGTGVKMEAVVRMIDNHVSKQIRTENSTLNRFGEKSDVISQLEVIFNEPSDTGLSFNIGEMFKAFQNLSENPGDLNYKTVAVEKMKTLTDTLNHMGIQIEGLTSETHEEIEKNVADFNSKVEQLDMLNKQIFNISIKGQVPNDLLDQRDLLLKEVSAISEIDVDFDIYGRVDIKMDGQEILTAKGKQQYIKYDYDKEDGSIKLANKDGQFIDEDGNVIEDEDKAKLVDVKIRNGKILGNMDAIKDVEIAESKLNDLAKTIGKSINEIHGEIKVRNELDPVNGELMNRHFDDVGDIFEFGDPEGALTIKVNEELLEDNSLLQGGGYPVGHRKYSQEDNSIALELAGLANERVGFDEDGNIVLDDPNGNTISGSYRDIIVKIGVSKQHSDNMVDNQIALTNQLEMRRETVSGVSINDEITDVIKFQAAYEANAKVISTLAEMLDVLINRTGV